MNHLQDALLALVIQATVVATAAVPLYLLVARRGPAAAGFAVTAALAVLALVPLAAFVPWPDLTGWELVPSASSPLPDDPDHTKSEAVGAGLPLSTVFAAWRELATAVRPPADAFPPSAWTWPEALSVGVLAGVLVGLARLGLAVWSLGRWVRRGRPVVDAGLTEQVEELRRRMGCSRRVGLRECPDLGSPATVGWMRPLILLPADWRSWTAPQRRAVLAHELAHIRRDDYLTGLFARAVVVLYFFHPLVRWLAGRLRLQQELAADALAAPLAGGRREYVVVLAQMALANEARPAAWPVRAFLPTPGTLMRRIDMLRSKEASAARPLSHLGRCAVVGLLLAVVAAAMALRGLAQSPEPTREPAPFDLTWVPADAQGVVGFRPAALFGRPGAAESARAVNAMLDQIFVPESGLHGKFGVRVEDVEQVTAGVFIKPMPGDEPRSSLMLSGLTIRTVKPFDWARQVKTWLPNVEEVKVGDRTYLKAPRGSAPILGPAAVCFFVPDDRTLVGGVGEDQMEQMLKQGAEPRFRLAATDAWKKAAGGLAVLAVDNRDKSWAANVRKEEAESHHLLPLVEAVEMAVVAVDGFDKGKLTLTLISPTEKEAVLVVKEVEALIAKGRALVAAEARAKESHVSAEVLSLWEGQLKQAKVTRQGAEVGVSAEVEGPMTLENWQRLLQGL